MCEACVCAACSSKHRCSYQVEEQEHNEEIVMATWSRGVSQCHLPNKSVKIVSK